MDISPLVKYRDYRLLYAAQFISFLGSMLTYVALPYQMYELTQSTVQVGMLGVVELVPLLLTAFWGGALADSVDKRRLILAMTFLLMIGSATLTALAWTRHATPIALLILAGFMSGVFGLQRPSIEALLPRLVGPDDMPAVAALGTFRGSVGMVFGTAASGVILATLGVSGAYALDACTYATALVLLFFMRGVPVDKDANPPSFAGIIDGFRYAKSRQELIGTYVVDFIAMVFGMPLSLFPAIAQLHGGAKAVGLLYAAPAVGMLVASATSAWTSRVTKHGLGVLLAAAFWGVGVILFGLVSDFRVALFWLAFAGGADAVSGIFRMTIWNQTIPQQLRGRLASIEMVSYMSGPMLGNFEAGLVAGFWDIKTSVISGGVLCVVGVVICGALLPRFVSYDYKTYKGAASALP